MPGDIDRTPSRWTGPSQLAVVVCSAVFVIGTALQAFLIIDLETMRAMMVLAGRSAAEAQAEAGGFLTGFRVVGCVYLAGNAVGLLALRGRAWVFWVVLLINLTQAAGLLVIPPEVGEVTRDRFGVAGLLPSLVTDGGAAVLSVALLVLLVRYRAPWAYRRVARQADPARVA